MVMGLFSADSMRHFTGFPPAERLSCSEVRCVSASSISQINDMVPEWLRETERYGGRSSVNESEIEGYWENLSLFGDSLTRLVWGQGWICPVRGGHWGRRCIRNTGTCAEQHGGSRAPGHGPNAKTEESLREKDQLHRPCPSEASLHTGHTKAGVVY